MRPDLGELIKKTRGKAKGLKITLEAGSLINIITDKTDAITCIGYSIIILGHFLTEIDIFEIDVLNVDDGMNNYVLFTEIVSYL